PPQQAERPRGGRPPYVNHIGSERPQESTQAQGGANVDVVLAAEVLDLQAGLLNRPGQRPHRSDDADRRLEPLAWQCRGQQAELFRRSAVVQAGDEVQDSHDDRLAANRNHSGSTATYGRFRYSSL